MNALLIGEMVRAALAEDLGRAGDLTSAATVPAEARVEALLVARQAGVVAGLPFAKAAFRALDPAIEVAVAEGDGRRVAPGAVLARIAGSARGVLAAERVALNFLGHLSGVATATAGIVAAVAHTRARVVCTRKTLPGLRAAQKYAVRCGGGANHRFGLDDAMLIKDNHIAIAGGVRPALTRARDAAGHLVKVEIEVDTLEQLAEALEIGVDVVLLDNMDVPALRAAVEMARGRALTEASGGITQERAAAVAETGVDLMSVGWITHSAPSLDVGLDIG